MEISSRRRATVALYTLDAGSVFVTEQGDICIRVVGLPEEQLGTWGVCLRSGDAMSLASDCKVRPLPHATLITD